MSRPKKVELDYFPCDTVFDEKIQTLESIFGNDGFTWIVKFWQKAYRNENGEVNLSKYFGEVMEKNCRITHEVHEKIKTFCLDIKLIKKTSETEEIYTSDGIQKRIAKVSRDRSLALKRYFKNKKKLKESKVKESKVKDFGTTSTKYWRSNFEVYKTEELEAFKKITSDFSFISERQKYHPNIDILLSLEKAHADFWATEAGWKNKKSTKSKEIDWTTTYKNALSLKSNQVYINKNKLPEKPKYSIPREQTMEYIERQEELKLARNMQRDGKGTESVGDVMRDMAVAP